MLCKDNNKKTLIKQGNRTKKVFFGINEWKINNYKRVLMNSSHLQKKEWWVGGKDLKPRDWELLE